jgi:phenylacetate-CoA ligase
MTNHRHALKGAWEIWQQGRSTPSTLAALQQARLDDLVQFARLHSPYYRALYQHLPWGPINRHDLPKVAKPALMEHFDAWVTDPEVMKPGVEAFVADKTLVGQRYLGRYALFTTSGTTGTPGIFLHDQEALAVYHTLMLVRAGLPWLSAGGLWTRLWRADWSRVALVAATGGHFTDVVETEQLRRYAAWFARRIALLSVFQPLPDLVQALNDVQPAVLVGYATALLLLAEEQVAGRLRIKPQLSVLVGEWVAPAARHRIEAAFQCRLREAYGASECVSLAFACGHDRLHVNADWVLLEPVDAAYQPVPPGHPSHTVLLTNLANRVQPLIRYDLGDSLLVDPIPCRCGSPLPAIQVEGRGDEILSLQTPVGARVAVLPIALATVVEETPGVRRFQLIQIGPAALSVRLEVVPGAERPRVWGEVQERLRTYLTAQGVPAVTIEQAREAPSQEALGGKFRQVWAEQSTA